MSALPSLPDPPRHALVLLAAGGSRRLGEPKQLLRLDGESLVRRAARLGLATAPVQALVVCGAHADAVWAEVADLPVQRLDCPAWAAGMGASLAAAVGQLRREVDGVMVLLCDQPALDVAHLLALRDAWRTDPRRASASAYGGVLGVPALLPRAWFTRLAGLDADRGARDLLRAHAGEVVGVKAPGLSHDIDHRRDAGTLGTPKPQE